MKQMRKRGFTLIELMIVVAIIGILAAIAIPNFIRFQARAKQGEPKSNLKALFTAQRSYFHEYDAYVTQIRMIGFSPERGNRYYYQLGATAMEDRSTEVPTTTAGDSDISVDTFKHSTALLQPGYRGTAFATSNANAPPTANPGGLGGACPACEFSGTATGNIDNESVGLDSWYVSSVDSTNTPFAAALVENVPAGQPQNTYNDVNNDA